MFRLDRDTLDALSPQAQSSAETWMIERLARLFTRLLYVEFKSSVARANRDLAFADPDSTAKRSRTHYSSFIDDLHGDYLQELILEYPLFGRFLSLSVEQWCDQIEEISSRIASDGQILQEHFGIASTPSVADLTPLTHDTHGNGKSVVRVDFDCGETVVYKPRTLASEDTFYSIVERLNPDLPIPDLYVPTVVDCNKYGWMEWMEPNDVEEVTGVERYYQRAGGILCLCYFLQYSDCHLENVIAAGDQPILVDGETVLSPTIPVEERPVKSTLHAFAQETIAYTHLIPWIRADSVGDGVAESEKYLAGFGNARDEAVMPGNRSMKVKALNTDIMSVDFVPERLDLSQNTPTVEGEPQPISDYLQQVIDGFNSTYMALAREYAGNSSAIEGDLFAGVKNVETRLIYRHTRRYLNLLPSLLSYSSLSSGVEFTIELEDLVAPFYDGSVTDNGWLDAYEAERGALKRLDVPRFTMSTNGDTVEWDGRVINVSLPASGYDLARERIAGASQADSRRQIELLEYCYGTRGQSVPEDGHKASQHRPGEAELVEEADRIMSQVQKTAIDRSSLQGWIEIVEDSSIDALLVRETGHTLYGGRCGIALPACALYYCTGDDRHRAFAETLLRPVRDALHAGEDSIESLDIGGGTGIGSIVYGFTAAGSMLEDDELLDDAVIAADKLSAKRIGQDEAYDVLDGAAGAILACLALYDRRDNQEVLDRAIECGDHLLSNRTRVNGVQVWDNGMGDAPLTGFSHGTAGVAYALYRLAQASGEDRYADAAQDALQYESSHYLSKKADWRDFRPGPDDTDDGWCHGRVGGCLARLGMSKSDPTRPVSDRIRNTLDAIDLDTTIGAFDHLCCGNAAKIELALEAEAVYGGGEISARSIAGSIISRQKRADAYSTVGQLEDYQNPSLFLGAPGIAFAFLRITEPEGLPNVLLWE